MSDRIKIRIMKQNSKGNNKREEIKSGSGITQNIDSIG